MFFFERIAHFLRANERIALFKTIILKGDGKKFTGFFERIAHF
jgi:hypothetical protein